MHTEHESRWLGAVALVGCLAFALPLLAHAYAGTGGRYLGDDYCAGYIFRDYGLIGGQVWHYKSWSAVPTTLMLMAATEPGGPRLAPVLPAGALVLWLVGATWTVRRLSFWSGRSWRWPLCLWVAEVVIYSTLQDSPNVAQSLYLRVPMLAYICPLVLLTAYGGWLAWMSGRNTRGSLPVIAGVVFAFAFGAFGPVCAAFLIAAIGIAWCVARLQPPSPRRDSLLRLLAVGGVGAVLALAVVAFAPGNAARQVRFPHPPGLTRVAVWSLLYSVFMFSRSFLPVLQSAIVGAIPYVMSSTPRWLTTALAMGTSPLPLALAIVTPFTLVILLDVRASGRRANAARWGIPIVAFVLVCACMAPGAYGTSAPPPPRALVIPQYVMTVMAACWGYALGLVWAAGGRRVTPRAQAGAMVVAGLSLLVPVMSTPAIVRSGAAMREWAQRWDETDRQIRNAYESGSRDAVVPALESVAGVGSISPDRNDWVNACAARYYGVRSITGITVAQ